MKKIGLVGQVNVDNYGDVLIFYMYAKSINDLGHKCYLYNASDKFVYRLEELGISITNYRKLEEFIGEIDFSLFIGGGYLGRPDYSDILWQKRWLEDKYFYNIAKSLNENGIEYRVEGVEVGPGLKPFVHKYVSEILSNAKNVCVRNSQSLQYIIENFKNINAEFVPDIVLSIDRFFPRVMTPFKNREYDLCIHVSGKVFGENFLSKNYRKLISKFVNQNKIRSVMVLSDQKIKSEHLPAIHDFVSEVKNCKVDIVDYNGIASIIDNVIRCKTVITSKLHLGVTGLVYGCNSVCIGSHPKLKRFYQEIGYGENYINFYSFSGGLKYRAIYRTAFDIKMELPVEQKEGSLKYFKRLEQLIEEH